MPLGSGGGRFVRLWRCTLSVVGDTGNEGKSSFARFLNLTNMPCSVLPHIGTGSRKNFDFLYNA